MTAKAIQLADNAGVSLGDLVFISDSVGASPRVDDVLEYATLKAVQSSAVDTRISGGELSADHYSAGCVQHAIRPRPPARCSGFSERRANQTGQNRGLSCSGLGWRYRASGQHSGGPLHTPCMSWEPSLICLLVRAWAHHGHHPRLVRRKQELGDDATT